MLQFYVKLFSFIKTGAADHMPLARAGGGGGGGGAPLKYWSVMTIEFNPATTQPSPGEGL